MEPARRPGGRAEVLRRAAVTAGAVLLSFALERLPLPFTAELRQAMGPGAAGSLGLGALGLRPLVMAFVVVEVVALVVPALRERRHAGWAARRPLTLAAWTLAVATAAFQAYGIASFLRSAQVGGLPVELGPAELAALGCSVVAGSVLLAGLAELISRRGLGNGFRLDWYVLLRKKIPQPIALHLTSLKHLLAALRVDAADYYNLLGPLKEFTDWARLTQMAGCPAWRGTGMDRSADGVLALERAGRRREVFRPVGQGTPRLCHAKDEVRAARPLRRKLQRHVARRQRLHRPRPP